MTTNKDLNVSAKNQFKALVARLDIHEDILDVFDHIRRGIESRRTASSVLLTMDTTTSEFRDIFDFEHGLLYVLKEHAFDPIDLYICAGVDRREIFKKFQEYLDSVYNTGNPTLNGDLAVEVIMDMYEILLDTIPTKRVLSPMQRMSEIMEMIEPVDVKINRDDSHGASVRAMYANFDSMTYHEVLLLKYILENKSPRDKETLENFVITITSYQRKIARDIHESYAKDLRPSVWIPGRAASEWIYDQIEETIHVHFEKEFTETSTRLAANAALQLCHEIQVAFLKRTITTIKTHSE